MDYQTDTEETQVEGAPDMYRPKFSAWIFGEAVLKNASPEDVLRFLYDNPRQKIVLFRE